MRLDRSHTFEDQKSKIKLIFESFEEPNYGRTFWKYKFYIEDNLADNELLKNDTEGLLTTLESFELSSIEGDYIFIPKYNPIVYNVAKNKFIEFKAPFQNGSMRLIKNYFHKNRLVLVYRKGIAVINLETNDVQSFGDNNFYIEEAVQINDEEIEVNYVNAIDYESKKKIIQL